MTSTREEPSLRWDAHSCGGATLPPLSGHSATLVDGRLVVIGGSLADGSLNDVVYALDTNSEPMEWAIVDTGVMMADGTPATGSVSPPARWRHTATVMGERSVLVYGGFAAKRNRYSDVWLLTFASRGGGASPGGTLVDDSIVRATWSKPIAATSQFTSDGNHVQKGAKPGAGHARGGKAHPTSNHSSSELRGALRSGSFSPKGSGPAGPPRSPKGAKSGRRSPMRRTSISHKHASSSSATRAAQGTGDVPAPRGGHSATRLGAKNAIYVFGGSGGYGFSAVDFNDLYTLAGPVMKGNPDPMGIGAQMLAGVDAEVWAASGLVWELVTPHGRAPAERCDHVAYGVKENLFVVGGWSSASRLNDVHAFDSASLSWSKLMPMGPGAASLFPARWGHCGVAVEAPTSSALFILGGSTSEATIPGKKGGGGTEARGFAVAAVRSMRGTLSSDIVVLTPKSEHRNISLIATQPPILGETPSARSLAAVVHDARKHRLLVVGGTYGICL